MKIELLDVSHDFYRKSKQANYISVLKNINLVFESPKIIGIVGHSGNGKSTLLNICCGLLKPTKGSVLLDGQDLYLKSDNELSVIRNEIFGILPQDHTFISSLNVIDNVMLPILVNKKNRKKLQEYTDWCNELLDRLGILNLAKVYPNELSGGELRRMCIARSLIIKPKFLFADEPTSDLDSDNTKEIFKLFRDITKLDIGIVLVSHENEISNYVDCLFSIEKGILAKVI